MNALDAVWVREHVWTQAMRKTHADVPRAAFTCACQSGLTTWCRNGRHDLCHRAQPLVSSAGYVCGPGGLTVAFFAEPYQHPYETATGFHKTSYAMFWLADRRCAWQCPCPCAHVGKRVVPDQGAGDDGTSRPIELRQLDLFEELMSA